VGFEELGDAADLAEGWMVYPGAMLVPEMAAPAIENAAMDMCSYSLRLYSVPGSNVERLIE
jgi:hypothetical protein